MDLSDFEYFIAVAEDDNMNKAAKRLGVVPATLSRSVARLEARFGVQLFQRVGKNIELNRHGRHLLPRARAVLDQVQSMAHELSTATQTAELRLAGRPALLVMIATSRTARVWTRDLKLVLRYAELDGHSALAAVLSGESNFSVTTQKPGPAFRSRELSTFRMVPCVATTHALAKARGPLAMAQVLAHDFAAPTASLLGQAKAPNAPDTWRDDLYPRRVVHATESLSVIEDLVRTGEAVGYLPDCRAEVLGLKVLDVDGLGPSATQRVHLGMRKILQPSHVRQAFDTDW